MGKGRKPEPNRLKLLKGNPGKRPIPEDLQLHGEPVAPEWLDDVARAKWDEVAPLLIAAGVTKAIDTTVLAAFCAAYSRWRQAEDVIDDEGFTTPGAQGQIVKHPAATVAEHERRAMQVLGSELGWSPSSRVKLTANSPPPKDKLDAFRTRKHG